MKTVIPLENSAKIVVIGGGPASSFFSILMLRKARLAGKQVSITILEKKKELQFYQNTTLISFREGCNYCAGGISPQLADILDDLKITIPLEVLQSAVESLIVHGEWKNIEVMIPSGRRMFSVFRGSKPRYREDRHVNFDAYLLRKAADEGAEIITGEAVHINNPEYGKPEIVYRERKQGEQDSKIINADFVVVATGINNVFGKNIFDDTVI